MSRSEQFSTLLASEKATVEAFEWVTEMISLNKDCDSALTCPAENQLPDVTHMSWSKVKFPGWKTPSSSAGCSTESGNTVAGNLFEQLLWSLFIYYAVFSITPYPPLSVLSILLNLSSSFLMLLLLDLSPILKYLTVQLLILWSLLREHLKL